MDGFPDVPQWHRAEHSLWAIGEQIRHALNSQPKLRSDRSLYAEFLAIVQNRHAMRGRQSFVLLFAYRPCIAWAHDLASLLPDSDIDGQIISALYKQIYDFRLGGTHSKMTATPNPYVRGQDGSWVN
jgi:hypothetical protein